MKMGEDFSQNQIETLKTLLREQFSAQDERLLKKVEKLVADSLKPIDREIRGLRKDVHGVEARLLQLETQARSNSIKILKGTAG